MDGHESHNHIEFIEKAREEGIILVELPSKTSHWTQPFDRTVFKSLKSNWNHCIHNFTSETGVAVGHSQFFRIFTKVWNGSMTTSNIENAFVATGICPYNPGVIPKEAFDHAELYKSTTVDARNEADTSSTSLTEDNDNSTTKCNEVQNSEMASAAIQQELASSASDPTLPVVTSADDATELNELQESMCVNLNIFSTDSVIDLPMAIDESVEC